MIESTKTFSGIESARLRLRELSLDDLEFIAETLTHPEVMRYWPRTYSRNEAIEWIEKQQRRYREDGFGYWLAIEKQSNRPVGQAGLIRIDLDGEPAVGLGYILHRPFWNMGYATEAATACLLHAFSTLRLREVAILVRPENEPSVRVAKRLGAAERGRTKVAGFQHAVFVVGSALNDAAC